MKTITMVGNILGGLLDFIVKGFLYIIMGTSLAILVLVIFIFAIVFTAF